MFNIQGAVQSLMARSGAKSQHACARFVRMAMESGGLNTASRPNWAWKYIQWLPTQGWSLVGNVKTNEAQAEWTRSSAKPGDIAVYQKPGVGGSQPGHICMYTGGQWISDFRQNRMGVYASPVNAYIFRYTGEVSNSPIDLSGIELGDGGSGGPATFEELNAETLASKCPENVEFKGMWMRYHLILGARSPIIQQFMNNAGTEFGDSPGWSGELAELRGSDALQKACQLISREECGVDYNQPLDQKFLVGYQLKGEGHKTYGWGQMYSADGKLMEQIRPVWTEQQLRDEFERTVAKHLEAINKTGINFTDNQKAVLSHRRHFGLKPFNDIIRRIKENGIPDSKGYFDMAIAYCKSCKNWNLYGRGWTNGVTREAGYWS